MKIFTSIKEISMSSNRKNNLFNFQGLKQVALTFPEIQNVLQTNCNLHTV